MASGRAMSATYGQTRESTEGKFAAEDESPPGSQRRQDAILAVLCPQRRRIGIGSSAVTASTGISGTVTREKVLYAWARGLLDLVIPPPSDARFFSIM
jgi:hypothetical protein